MLTTILSAVCAVTLGASVVTTPADTLNVYMINGERVENFSGSQLIGKTVSDYKTMVSSSIVNGKTTITKIHVIRTDGKQSGQVTANMVTVGDGTSDNCSITIVGSDADSKSCVSMSGLKEDKVEVFINGKKQSKTALEKLKPEDIASITMLRAGSKAAAKTTKSKDHDVILVTLKNR